jgi:transcriptional regulator with XRE-family HTH domain
MESKHPLREYRDREGITAHELAQRIGVRPNTVWRWENGRQRIAPGVVMRVHRETRIPLEELVMFGLRPGEAAE